MECVELFVKLVYALQLGCSDAWYCPNCRRYQQGTVKRLSLWTLPEILVIHLKRFKQVECAIIASVFPFVLCLPVSCVVLMAILEMSLCEFWSVWSPFFLLVRSDGVCNAG